MTDSSSFSSLFALVDSHLSKSDVQNTENQVGGIPIPSLGIHRGSSDTRLRGTPPRLPIPRFSASESPITNVLSEQLSNMLKAKELKKQQELEKEKLQEEMKKLQLEENSCVIDLMRAVQKPGQTVPCREQTLSSSSSFESLIIDKSEFIVGSPSKTENVVPPTPEPLLPCKTDLSYICNCKLKMAKCSPFGKVLTSKLRPVAAPYLSQRYYKSDIKRFDFKTKSPCDLIKEKLRKPSSYSHSEDYIGPFNIASL